MPEEVMVVDDSILFKKALIKIIDELPGVEVVGSAGNGKEAIRNFEKKPVDIVTLDLEMPLMSGLEVIPELLKIKKDVKIIMISSVTQTGASETLKALSLGAKDFITKAQSFGIDEDQKTYLTRTLKEKFSVLLAGKTTPRAKAVNELDPKPVMASKVDAELLLIGISTGGPEALNDFFKHMKEHRNYITVIVQHMPPIFTEQLAKSLMSVAKRSVVEARQNLSCKKGDVVIAAGGKHLKMKRVEKGMWSCQLDESPAVNFCRPSVDVTFESVSKELKRNEAVACIMTGIGSDGLKGCKSLAAKNVPILTQSLESCAADGMPKSIVQAGLSCAQATPTFLAGKAESFMLNPGIR